MKTRKAGLAFLIFAFCAVPLLAGSSSDTSVAKVRLKLRSNRYEVKSIRLEDDHPSLTIGTLHERAFKLRASQTLEVYLDDTNPLLFDYPDPSVPCAIQKLPTANAKVIGSFEAAIGGGAGSSDATSAASSDTLESDDRSAGRAQRGACGEDNPRAKRLMTRCEDVPSYLTDLKVRVGGKLSKKQMEDLKSAGISDVNTFLSELKTAVERYGGHATCVPQLVAETAANLPCVKTVVDDWGDPKTLEDKAQQLNQGARAVSSTLDFKDGDDEVALLREAANLPAQAKVIADFLRVLPEVGQPIKVATFTYDRSNNQLCTITITPRAVAGVGASAASYYWHGTTRVNVIPQSSYSLGIGAGLVYSFVRKKDISAEPKGAKFLVTQKDSSDYTGQGLAAMLTITPTRWQDADFTPSFEFGVNPKKDLGLYLGAGFQIGDHFTFGAGVAFEQIDTLSGGQKPGDLLDHASDLKTDKMFKSGLYVHFTIGTGFDFFKK